MKVFTDRSLFPVPPSPLTPAASGQFTYWSQRTRARPFNKGLRLDYFVCSKEMFDDADDDDVVVITEDAPSSSSSTPAGETELPDQVTEVQEKEEKKEEVKEIPISKAKASRKRAQPPIESEKSVIEETVKSPLPSRAYPNPTNVKVLDSYILPYENDCSDHCPIVLIVERTAVPP